VFARYSPLSLQSYSSVDYALDRIKRLEREMGQLKEASAKVAIRGPSILTTVAPLGSNIDGTKIQYAG